MMLIDTDRIIAAFLFALMSVKLLEVDPTTALLGFLAAGYSVWSAFDHIDPAGV